MHISVIYLIQGRSYKQNVLRLTKSVERSDYLMIVAYNKMIRAEHACRTEKKMAQLTVTKVYVTGIKCEIPKI